MYESYDAVYHDISVVFWDWKLDLDIWYNIYKSSEISDMLKQGIGVELTAKYSSKKQ